MESPQMPHPGAVGVVLACPGTQAVMVGPFQGQQMFQFLSLQPGFQQVHPQAVFQPELFASQQQQPPKQKPPRSARAPQASRQRQHTSATSDAMLVAAVESLCADQLRPDGRILCKRLAELGEVGNLDIKTLQAACESCPHLDFHAKDAFGDWFATLPERASGFVDIYSPEDPYPHEMWESLEHYLGGLDAEDMAGPGGRYSCAQLLVSRGLPFLESFSLGQVCHIVQLAVSQRHLLGYLNGGVVPYRYSRCKRRDECAQHQRPSADVAGPVRLATWKQLRSFVQVAVGGSRGSVPLASLKRRFRCEFRAELSETALGYAKLSELLQDPRVNDLCCVRATDNGYWLFPQTPDPAPSAKARGLPRLGERDPAQHASAPPAARRRPAALVLDPDAAAEACACATPLIATPALEFPPTPEGETPRWAPAAAAAAAAVGAGLPTLLVGRTAARPAAERGPKAAAGAAEECPPPRHSPWAGLNA